MDSQTDDLFGEPISVYTDAQALDDGVLVAVPGDGGVNRVTRAVFDHLATPVDTSGVISQVMDVTTLMEAIRAMLRTPPDNDGWRTGIHQGRELWLIPNEVGGLTLMFPDDY